MASSKHDAEAIKEHFCDRDTLVHQASRLAHWIREAGHVVFFTGAGISTSAGIPDFRGPRGVRTLQAQGKVAKSKTTIQKAIPTTAHMTMVALQSCGDQSFFLISQNTDGLHRRSGVHPSNLAELHGNSNLETCGKCGSEYLRDYRCRSRGNSVHEHVTGRYCACGGQLTDSIINFGESLPAKALNAAYSHSRRADVFVVLGSSLTVSPANEMPTVARKHGAKVVICNLQKTPLDANCDMRVFARTDDLMVEVLRRLDLDIPDFVLSRRVQVEVSPCSGKGKRLTIDVIGIEVDGTPASIFSAVTIKYGSSMFHKTDEPYSAVFEQMNASTTAIITLHFMGHYNEPNHEVIVSVEPKSTQKKQFLLNYNPKTGNWVTVRI